MSAWDGHPEQDDGPERDPEAEEQWPVAGFHPCPRCEGLGLDVRYCGDDPEAADHCPDCGGSGFAQ